MFALLLMVCLAPFVSSTQMNYDSVGKIIVHFNIDIFI